MTACPNCGTPLAQAVAAPGLDTELLGTAQRGVEALVLLAGRRLDEDGLGRTPERVVRAFLEMTGGVEADPAELLSARFSPGEGEPPYDELVVLRGVRFVSLCEHHLMPFSGVATVAYLPKDGGQVVGVSKLARLVECFAHRLQIQERFTVQVAKALEEHAKAAGSACIVRATHQCMACRGVRSDAEMVTSAVYGKVRDVSELRAELMALAL